MARAETISDSEYALLCERNYARDTYLHFMEYFKQLQVDLNLYLTNPSKNPKPTINPIKLEENYAKFLKIAHNPEQSIPLFTSYREHFYPTWLTNCACWLTSGFGYGYSGIGVELIRADMRDLLLILAKAGDRRAKTSKKKHKLPRELVGKQLRWEKINEIEWKVTIEPNRELICEYDKIYRRIWGDK